MRPIAGISALAIVVSASVLLAPALGGSSRHSNGLIAFTRQNASGADQILVMRPDGKGQRALTPPVPGGYDPAWSPDGRRIAFTDRQDRLAVMNADGSGRRVLTRESGLGTDESPQWSPNGKRLVFEVNYGGDSKFLTVIKADGTGKHRLRVGLDPDWSPDGRRIVFVGLDGLIALVGTDGRGVHRLTHTGCSEHPRWSPDGKRIVFMLAGDCFDPHRVAVMQANGKGIRKVTPKRANPRWNGLAEWAPDGTKIVFSAGREFGAIGNVYVMNPDGSHRQQLTSTGDDFDPSWQPK